MNLRRASNEELLAELQARASGEEQQILPTDTTKNYLLLERDNSGKFMKRT